MIALPTDLTATIPKDWTISKLGEAAHLKNGSAFKTDDWMTTGIPIVRIQNLKDRNAAFNYFQGNPELKVPLKKGDLVFSWSGSIGTSFGPHYWWGDVAVLNQHIFRVDLRPEAQLTKSFLYYALLHLTKEIESHAYGLAALVHVRKGDLEATRISVPPLDEQRKIAAVLGLVQQEIEQQERLIALTTEFKKTLLQKLFTEGLHGEPQKQTEIGPVPQSWEVVELISAVEKIDYGISAPIPKTPPENGIKIVSTADITKDGRMLYEKMRRIEAPEKTVNRLILRTGDVLFNWRNSAELIGKSAVFKEQKEPHIFASFILRIRCGEKKSHNFFLAHLMNYFRDHQVFIKLARRAVNQANYNRNEISVLKIPLPCYREQREIADVIAVVDTKIALHRCKHATLTILFRTLLHQLMTAQIRVGKLDIEELNVGDS